MFNMNQTHPKASAPYWTDSLDRGHELPISVESVVGILSQSATEETKAFTLDEGALKV